MIWWHPGATKSHQTMFRHWNASNKYHRSRFRMSVWFTLPAVTILFIVLAYPIFSSLLLSFQDISLTPSGVKGEFIGLDNYIRLINSDLFRQALFRSTYFTLTEVILTLTLGLGVALLLNHPEARHPFFRVALLVPWVLAPVANAVLWKWIYNANHGILNVILISLGLIDQNIVWLGKPWLALNMLLLADVWKAIPFIALLLLAGLQNIPSHLYRAAQLDGATQWQQFIYITFPGLRTSLTIAAVLQSIWALKVFDLIYVLTKGSPADGTVLLNYLAWRETFSNLDIGYGAAIANILFLLMFMLALAYIQALRAPQSKK